MTEAEASKDVNSSAQLFVTYFNYKNFSMKSVHRLALSDLEASQFEATSSSDSTF